MRSRSRGKPVPNYQPKDRYKGRLYEDDPRALPPGPLVRLAPAFGSGCGNSAAMCLAGPVHSREGYRSPFSGQRIRIGLDSAHGYVSPRAAAQ